MELVSSRSWVAFCAGAIRNLSKEDIPAAQQAINHLLNWLREPVGKAVDAAVRGLRHRLEEILLLSRKRGERPAPGDDLVVILASIVEEFWSTLRHGLEADERVMIRAQAARVLAAGAASVDGELELTRLLVLQAAAAADLEFWSLRPSARLRAAVETEIRDALVWTLSTTRIGLGGDAPGRVARLLSEGLLSDEVVDSWGYRQHTVGQLEGAAAAGVEVLIARAVLDENTTTFCRWVDGRIVNVAEARARVADYDEAVAAGDAESAMRAWPFEHADFPGIAAARLGPPPYHNRCRTTLVRAT